MLPRPALVHLLLAQLIRSTLALLAELLPVLVTLLRLALETPLLALLTLSTTAQLADLLLDLAI